MSQKGPFGGILGAICIFFECVSLFWRNICKIQLKILLNDKMTKCSIFYYNIISLGFNQNTTYDICEARRRIIALTIQGTSTLFEIKLLNINHLEKCINNVSDVYFLKLLFAYFFAFC
jgi:hypothetical protein